jgi:hypothetical protein
VLHPAKVGVARSRVLRGDRKVDVLAPITKRASGMVAVDFHAAGRHTRFEAPVDEENGRLRFKKGIPRAQADLGTGIVTLRYPGDEDTRPQEVRLRAASQKAKLELERPRIEDGRVKAQGTISKRARGVVRLQLQYVVGGQTETVELRGRIDEGRWKIDEALSQEVREGIARRSGPVHSYTLFTGYFPRRIRGEMQSYEVAFGPGDQAPAGDGAPGAVEGLSARATSPTEVVLTFLAAGSNGTSPPPASRYVVKQSLKPIADAGDFKDAQTLCGSQGCGFDAPGVGQPLDLTITDLRPNTTYYYAVAARNEAGQQGPRSQTVRVQTK